mmetsp:Transcript_8993/g.31321  ORF Transcript_8993/g.31321 Transcript_8993/m.31321 type:complete len:247 (-) Transcript_8993:422-1162(-)
MSSPLASHAADMLGKYSLISPAGLWEISRKAHGDPVALHSASMALATTSLGASSSLSSYLRMKRSPCALSSTAPWPRTASETRNELCCSGSRASGSSYSDVGWNWTNSMLESVAPARNAMARPSPVATPGLVVEGYTCPAPPDASMVAAATKRRRTPVRTSMASAPTQWCAPPAPPRARTRSSARWCSYTSTPGWLLTAARRARSISWPVASAACTMRWCVCPPSRARWYSPVAASRVKAAPSCAR